MPPRRKSHPRTFESLSLSELSSEYATRTQQFAPTPFAAALARTISHEVPPPPTITLTRCLCLGLGHGNFARGAVYPFDDGSDQRRYRSPHQLVFLVSLLTVLGERHRIRNREVYFQDPDFGAVETEFLRQRLGYTVLSDPGAYAKMTPSTLLFAPCVSHWVRVGALEVALPALYVSVDVGRDFERMGPGYECSLARVPLQEFGRLRDVTEVRRLPGGEGDVWEEWIAVCSMGWVRGRTKSFDAVRVVEG